MPKSNRIKTQLSLLLFLITVIYCQGDPSCSTSTGQYNNITGCVRCDNNLTDVTIFNVDSSKYTCANNPNCQQVNNKKQCVLCSAGFQLINKNCYKSIPNCLRYDMNATTNGSCIECQYAFMEKPNCTVNVNYCQSFNDVLGICQVCNRTGEVMDQSRQFCRKDIPNCVIYDYDGCGQCQEQYVVTNSKTQCLISTTIEYQIQTTQIITINPTTQTTQTKTTTLCLQNNYYFTSNKCTQAISNFPVSGNTITSYYCKTFDTPKSVCTECIEGYYLTQDTCSDCSITINNCLTCSSTNCTGPLPCVPNCTICQPTHYAFLYQGQYICRQCSTYGCKKCQVDENQAIVCIQCQRGKTLFNNTCYSCPEGFELSVMTLQCVACPINCSSCQNGKCTWCNKEYVRDSSNVCVVNTTLSSISNNSASTMFEILAKHFPNQQTLIYNDEVSLMSSCKGQATRFSCLCDSNSSLAISSLCYSLTQASKFTTANVLPSPINASQFIKNSQPLRLMAQLPSFDNLTFSIQFSSSTGIYFSESKIASLLQIYAQVLRRQPPTAASSSLINNRLLTTNTTLTLKQLFNMAEYSFKDTFSRQRTTVIYGNGYYMKYYPAVSLVAEEGQFVKVSDRNVSQPLFVFIWFDNLNSSKSLTGTVYAYSSLAPYDVTVQIQQITYPSGTLSYQMFENGISSSIAVQKTNKNSLLFKMKTSTAAIFNNYNVQYKQTTAVDVSNLFNNQRIQFIFYQSAFIYVLVFLVAYLFLIPCCALLDFISPKRAQHRKRVSPEDPSNQQDRPATSQSSSQQTIQISINYKDFFPLYNICNTPRPKRILKLCLFLLNMQHGITFLTLIYFGLGAGHPVVAVVIGIPAYFCTIIMGYICGILTIVIPGWFKYMINLFVLGYWILWVALMPRFSPQYQPYVVIFACVFFVLDLIIDCLEMFMVYFSIIKSQKQTKMFECLAAWLSKRGYYEYDELAHQMQDDNDN